MFWGMVVEAGELWYPSGRLEGRWLTVVEGLPPGIFTEEKGLVRHNGGRYRTET